MPSFEEWMQAFFGVMLVMYLIWGAVEVLRLKREVEKQKERTKKARNQVNLDNTD